MHSTFCSPFSSIELSTAISQLSTSTSSGPDQITYPFLSHLPQSALHFLLYIFNLSWSTHTFPSAWKQSTIIPILKPGKPSDSPSSYRPISLTSCTSKLFERMVLEQGWGTFYSMKAALTIIIKQMAARRLRKKV